MHFQWFFYIYSPSSFRHLQTHTYIHTNPVESLDLFDMEFKGETKTLTIEDAVRVLLKGLGEDVNREGLRKTPLRVAKAFREGTRGYEQNEMDIVSGALFPEPGPETKLGYAGGSGGPVMVRDLDLFSYCESCLLPFQVKCHVGYVPSGQRVVGLSKLSRVAEVYAKRLQEPQRLAHQVCSALQRSIKPAGVAIILRCSHIHLPDFKSSTFKPNHKGWIGMSVKSGSGIFQDEKADLWMDFISLLRFNDDIEIENGSIGKSWCPSWALSHEPNPFDPEMLGAVSSILCSLGEDPLRKELVQTPARYLSWLMNFKSSNDLEINGGLGFNGDHHHHEEEEDICTELNIPFLSQCEHHLLPFHGVVHVGYRGGSDWFGTARRSMVHSVVRFYGFKLQVQERLTRQIAKTVSSLLGDDVIVVTEAAHSCMISRGIEKLGCTTASIAVLGRFSTEPSMRKSFLQMIGCS